MELANFDGVDTQEYRHRTFEVLLLEMRAADFLGDTDRMVVALNCLLTDIKNEFISEIIRDN